MIETRSERRAMARAKEKHVKDMMSGGYNAFEDITYRAHLSPTIAASNNPPKQIWLNNCFIVQLYEHTNAWGADRVMIRWNDARPEIGWAMLQRIKNDIFGPERVALEVFPKESNKQDVANVYWLWLLPEGFDCPIEVKRSQQRVRGPQ